MNYRAAVISVLMLIAFAPAIAGNAPDGNYQRGCNAYSDGAYFTAFHDLLPFAARGDAQAQFFVAEMLRTGLGVKRNQAEALIWYRRAAEQGHLAAQCNLGTSLYRGWGTEPSPQKAIDWWLQAALSGSGYAMYNIGIAIGSGDHVKRDYVRAFRWMLAAAKAGYSSADTVLASLRKVMTADQLRRAETMSLDEAMRFSRRRPGGSSPPDSSDREQP